ncbi:MAG: TRIC cation channel family protein [Actinobacteria bacterium]|nr:TRIC cation channel family protein [Actinomycetota bacterium]MCB0920000.1 TRIC cation channel family protein [Actinomycetota bacterium]
MMGVVSAVLADSSSEPVANLLRTAPELPSWAPYVAVGFGALAGAAFAARRGFDIIGVLGLAIAQGMGGLLLKDILLQTGTPEVLENGWYLIISVGAGLLGFFFAGLMARAVQSALIIDALSLGLLCAIGTNDALIVKLGWVPSMFIGVMTAVGGLILRDIMAGRAPEVLRPGIYVAFAAMVGSFVFVVVFKVLEANNIDGYHWAQLITVVVVASIRMASVHFGWVTHEPTDFSDRVWDYWRKKVPSPQEDTGPITQMFDRKDL